MCSTPLLFCTFFFLFFYSPPLQYVQISLPLSGWVSGVAQSVWHSFLTPRCSWVAFSWCFSSAERAQRCLSSTEPHPTDLCISARADSHSTTSSTQEGRSVAVSPLVRITSPLSLKVLSFIHTGLLMASVHSLNNH